MKKTLSLSTIAAIAMLTAACGEKAPDTTVDVQDEMPKEDAETADSDDYETREAGPADGEQGGGPDKK